MKATPAVSNRFRVRQVKSGYTGAIKFYVYDTVRKGRVTVHAHHSWEGAQADADDLNVGDMVRDYDEDPRPYDVRLAEARAAYREAKADA